MSLDTAIFWLFHIPGGILMGLGAYHLFIMWVLSVDDYEELEEERS